MSNLKEMSMGSRYMKIYRGNENKNRGKKIKPCSILQVKQQKSRITKNKFITNRAVAKKQIP